MYYEKSSNATNIFQDIFIIPIEDITKNNTWPWKSANTAKTSSNFEKKSKYESQITLGKVTKFYEIWMSY